MLHLGVVDVPYSYAAFSRSGQRRRVRTAGTKTTGDVAEILEAKYHLMQVFFDNYREQIGEAFLDGLKGHMENLLMGGPVGGNPHGDATQFVEQKFHDFISNQVVEHVGIPGVPTQAALRGVNHRLAHPYARANPRRPSFRDTGLYEGNFRAWVD